MTRRAFHHLILPDGRHYRMAVASFDEEGRFLSHHPLCGEEPFVEWVGGTLDLCQERADEAEKDVESGGKA